ncbi:MAG: hypothetical protein IAE87_12480 [Rhodobacteraceae bacterium]|jgi:hypothetical protein|nr:hypothetical protein [Paracoccaceae bacterium]
MPALWLSLILPEVSDENPPGPSPSEGDAGQMLAAWRPDRQEKRRSGRLIGARKEGIFLLGKFFVAMSKSFG